MKKTLSILLTLAMLLTSCMLLVSCDKVSEKAIEKDPYKTLNTAWKNTANRFFPEDKEAAKVMEKVADKGKFTVSFESTDLDIDLTKLGATVYTDSKNQQAVADLSAVIAGKEIGADIYLSEEMLALSAPALLGTEDAFAVYFATFAENLKGSALADMFDLDAETITEIQKVFADISAEAEEGGKEAEKEAKEFIEKLYNTLKMSVSTEDAGKEGGKEDYVVVTYALNNETLDQLITDLEETYLASLDPEIAAEIKEALAEVKLDMTAKLCINPKRGYIEEIKMEGSVTVKEETATFKANLAFMANDIVLRIEGSASEESLFAEAKLSKEETNENTSYRFTLSGGTGNVTAKLLDATYTIAENGDFIFSADVFEDESSTTHFDFKGNYQVTKEKLSLSLTELTMDEETYKFNFTISAEAVSEIPAFPENAKDVVKMSYEEWEEIIMNMMTGAFGSIPDFGY